jgi:hypothetical protein
MTAKSLALVIGVIFIAVGLLGFIENPIVGTSPNAIFHADQTHNIVHIVSGVLFVLIALAAPGAAAGLMILFGLVYLGLGILGLVTMGKEGMGTLLGFLHVNGNDNYLHIGLGVIIFLAGVASRRPRRVAT